MLSYWLRPVYEIERLRSGSRQASNISCRSDWDFEDNGFQLL